MSEVQKKTKIGFIGFGNMASAMAEGLIVSGAVSPSDIFACSAHYDKMLKIAEKTGINAAKDAVETAERAHIVIIAVKPCATEQIASQIKEIVKEKGKIVISVVWGRWFDQYNDILPGAHLICTIPNVPISAGRGVLAVENKHSLEAEEYELFKSIFSKISAIETVETQNMSQAGILSACAPAYAAMFVEALADAGVQYGLKRDTAYSLAASMIEGTGGLIARAGQIPAAIKDAVCSPSGATIRGVAALEHSGFRGDVMSAIEAVMGE